jgi:hypothetical protein
LDISALNDIYGIDFTSTPTPRKQITCIYAQLDGDDLHVHALWRWSSLSDFEAFLQRPGPWVAGMDFPFSMARRFIETSGWPARWADYVAMVGQWDRAYFRQQLDDYRALRPAGDKEHRRQADVLSGAISPQKLYGTPVGLMFYEGAPRLLASGLHLPGLHSTEDTRVGLECYPALLARRYIGRTPYKQDDPAKQTPAQLAARQSLWQHLQSEQLWLDYGIRLHAQASVIDDPSGDAIDALLCAIQAAWATRQGPPHFGQPRRIDPLEGWINDPQLTAS